jgi:mannan endo-1,4-beta-mannosidase
MKNKNLLIFIVFGLVLTIAGALNLKYNFIPDDLLTASFRQRKPSYTKTTTTAAADTIAPKVISFDIQPMAIVLGNQITGSFTVTDSGGSYLKTVNLNRAPYSFLYCNENNQSRCVWTAVASVTVPANLNSWSSALNDNPGTGDWWYGLEVLDGAGKTGYEPATIKVSVGNAPAVSPTSTPETPPATTTTPVATTTPAATTTIPAATTTPSTSTTTSTSTTPATTTPATTTTTTPTAQNFLWGAYAGDMISDLAPFESLAGKSVNMRVYFWGWGDSFPSGLGADLKASGKTLVLFWEQYGTTLDRINSGEYDTYISQFATAAKNYGGQVILAPLHEMNGNWDPWDGTVSNNTPAKIIAAWRRIHDKFLSVANVKFAWDVNNVSVPNTTANAITAYYPGDDYVDYVGVDGFNFDNPWQTWSQVFSNALNTLKQYNKPIYIFSTACAPGLQKAQWILDMGAGVKQYNIAGWLWFNVNKEKDWRINSDSASLSAFQSILP